MEYYVAERKKEFLLFATVWMDLDSIMLRKKPGGEREIIYDLIYKWNLVNKTNQQAK